MNQETMDRLKSTVVSPEQIAQAKASLEKTAGRVKIASVPLEENSDDVLEVLIKVPNRKDIGNFEKYMNIQPTKAKEVLINSCVLSSKDDIMADDWLFFTTVGAIADQFPIGKAVVKNC